VYWLKRLKSLTENRELAAREEFYPTNVVLTKRAPAKNSRLAVAATWPFKASIPSLMMNRGHHQPGHRIGPPPPPVCPNQFSFQIDMKRIRLAVASSDGAVTQPSNGFALDVAPPRPRHLTQSRSATRSSGVFHPPVSEVDAPASEGGTNLRPPGNLDFDSTQRSCRVQAAPLPFFLAINLPFTWVNP
jgi:hypothetical protein